MALPETLQDLLDKSAYPHSCAQITLIETHISWVLLTGEFAYKLKKPVKFSFLDFSTLELREHFCREELRCNRAFAPSLYVDIVPVYRCADRAVRIGGTEQTGDTLLEWAVKMRQFDPAMQLDRLLDNDAVTTGMLASFGRELAARHAELPRLKGTASEIERRVFAPVRDNFGEVAATGLQARHADLLQQTQELSTAAGRLLQPLLTERIVSGFVRECHGDLHLSNLACIDGKVTAFDCLEFNPNLRWIDTFNDVAFLFMDCHERGRGDLAHAFLDGYLDASGDYRGAELLGYFAAYRSMVRAKVAALSWGQEHTEDAALRFTQHVRWARDWLARSRGTLVLMCGLSGAGKSWIAERLLLRLPAIRLRSDVARKALAGLKADTRTDSPVGGGIYTRQQSDAVFEYLARVTETLLRGGDNVIVDATFIEHARRNAFLTLARQLEAKVCIVYCKAPVAALRARLTSRAAAGADPSEATLDVLELQLSRFEPPCAPEPVIEVATDSPLDNSRLQRLAAAILA
jgi:uncharacterized protein